MNRVFDIKQNTMTGLIIVYMIIGLAFMFAGFGVDSEFFVDYYFVLASYFICFGAWIYHISKCGFYLFEPSTMVLGLTIITFSIEPLYSILVDDTDLAGFYVFDGCKKATVIYVFAVLFFMFIYYNNFSIGRKSITIDENESDDIYSVEDVNNKELLTLLAYVFVLIGVGVSVVDLIRQGYSLNYILTLGTSGTLDTSEDSLGVFINLRYFMFPGLLYLTYLSKNKIVYWGLIFVAFACFFMRNKRWIIVLLLMALFITKYIYQSKKPDMRKLLIIAVPLAILLGAMQYMRGVSTSVSAVDWSGFTLEGVWGAFSGNFDLYKTLYGAVTYFPSEHFYTMGQQLIYLTLVTCIPRAIWPSKPYSIIDTELKQYFMGAGAVSGHWAYAQLTEFYVEFGWLGVAFFMGLFAVLCKKLRNIMNRKKSLHSVVLYSFMFPMLMQIVIRGYTPNNFYPVLFMVIPVFIMMQAEKIQ